MRSRERPVFVGLYRGGSGWLDETATIKSGGSTTERINFGLRMGALWAVSVYVNVARMNATNSDGGT